MDTPHRMPLQELPLEHFISPTTTKTPRKHKRPLSPSATPLNPAKRRVLDAEGIPPSSNVSLSSRALPAPFIPSNMHSITSSRPSHLRIGHPQSHGRSKGTPSPLSSQRSSSSRELYLKPRMESSTDPQSKHYPGFDIFRDAEQRRGSPSPRTPSDGNTLVNRNEEDKENVPLRRRTKKSTSKKRPLSTPDGLDPSCSTPTAQKTRVVLDHLEQTPFSARQALR